MIESSSFYDLNLPLPPPILLNWCAWDVQLRSKKRRIWVFPLKMSISKWYRNALKAYSDTAWKNASFELNLSSVALSVQKLLRLSWDMSKRKIVCWATFMKSHIMIQNWLKNIFLPNILDQFRTWFHNLFENTTF